MMKLKYLYKLMCDDLKDAEMMIEFGNHFVSAMDRDEANYYASEASKRLDNFVRRNSRFAELMNKKDGESKTSELIELFYKHHINWYEELIGKLNTLNKMISTMN